MNARNTEKLLWALIALCVFAVAVAVVIVIAGSDTKVSIREGCIAGGYMDLETIGTTTVCVGIRDGQLVYEAWPHVKARLEGR